MMKRREDQGGIFGCGGPLWPALLILVAVAGTAAADATISAEGARQLIVDRHPAVVAARAALERAEASGKGRTAWSDPELDGRLLWDGDDETALEAALRFAIPWSGRLSAVRRAADLEIELARLGLEMARAEAEVEADRLLARLAWSRSLIELRRSLADRSSEQAGLARQRQRASLADPLDVSLVLADAARDRRALIEGRNREASISARLLLLAQLPVETEIEVAPLTWTPRIPDREVLLALARDYGSALAAARLRLARAVEEVSAASRARVPDLHVGPALTREGGESSWGLSVGIPLPVFPRTRAGLASARAGLRGAEATLHLEEQALPVRVGLFLDRLAALQDQLDELEGEAAVAAEQAFRLAQARWNAGKIDVLHLLSAHRAFAEIRIERLETMLQLRETWLDLSLAVGLPPDRLSGLNDTETAP